MATDSLSKSISPIYPRRAWFAVQLTVDYT